MIPKTNRHLDNATHISRRGLLPWLFGINFFISAFTFGGGYVVVPMVKKYFVNGKKLFTEEELMEMAAVAQSTPGAIAINLSALAGYRCAGVAGAAVSSLAAVFPPLLILSLVSVWYAAFAANPLIAAVLKGMQAAVAALIVDFCADMCRVVLREKSVLLTLMVPAAFIGSYFLNINVIWILAGCCLMCVARVWYKYRKAAVADK